MFSNIFWRQGFKSLQHITPAGIFGHGIEFCIIYTDFCEGSLQPQSFEKEIAQTCDYSEEFGEPEEAGDDRLPLNLTVPATIKAKLEAMRSETGKSISQIVTDIVTGL